MSFKANLVCFLTIEVSNGVRPLLSKKLKLILIKLDLSSFIKPTKDSSRSTHLSSISLNMGVLNAFLLLASCSNSSLSSSSSSASAFSITTKPSLESLSDSWLALFELKLKPADRAVMAIFWLVFFLAALSLTTMTSFGFELHSLYKNLIKRVKFSGMT